MKPQVDRALGSYLAVRARSGAEIAAYLKHKGVEEQEIQALLVRYQELGIVDDEDFIRSVIESYLKKGKGPLFIRQKLMQAGIPREVIGEKISAVTTLKWRQSMQKRLTKNAHKYLPLEPGKKRLKMVSDLCSSGFPSGEAARFIDDWGQTE